MSVPEEEKKPSEAPSKSSLPEVGRSMQIPDQYRFPFHGKTQSPTAVPSPTERQKQLGLLQVRRRRRTLLLLLSSILLLFLLWTLGLFLAPRGPLPSPVPGTWKLFASVLLAALAASAGLLLLLGLYAGAALFGKSRAYPLERDPQLRRALRAALVATALALLAGAASGLIPAAERATAAALWFAP